MEKDNLSLFLFDLEYVKKGYKICGCDEAGRGPLAGPVVVAAVVMPLEEDKILREVNDSKKLTEKKRNELFEKIKDIAIAYSIQEVDEQTIDKINILEATKLGMNRAITKMQPEANFALVDAVKKLELPFEYDSLIKGDAKSYSIACASILAKVYRDRLMEEYDKLYPLYNFKKHKGYGTKEHIQNLKQFGKCKIHRDTFIKNFIEKG